MVILLAGLAAGSIAFFGMRSNGLGKSELRHGHDGKSRLPELEWLRRKLDLTEEQFTKVASIHESYRPTCEELCMKVMASHSKIKNLANPQKPVSSELEQALKEHALLHAQCQTAMLNHLHNTASVLSNKQAQDYLELMLPQIIELPLEPGAQEHSHP